ncbi:MAG: hypothetical protein KKH80_00745, partial [Candidatus Omnitrophica bacterium]|nr:hypothetical protein [Candidatus Omnitrophota bacterium]
MNKIYSSRGFRVLFLLSVMALIVSFSLCLPSSAQENSAKVTDIEINGNRSISTITVLSKMKTRVGSLYSENIINDDLKRLYLLGYFSDIEISTEDYKDGIKVIINVTERPIVDEVKFNGFRHIRMKEEKLVESVQTRKGRYLDYPSLNEDVLELEKIYVKKGFSKSRVEYKVDIDEATNKAIVQFKALEGERTKIKRVYVKGNNRFPDKRILKIIKTKRAWLFGGGILKDEVLEEDIERIRS